MPTGSSDARNPDRSASAVATPTRSRPVRQLRAERTRERLLVAGREAFSDLGHDAVNLKTDILEPAGVSVGSFYHQFHDKTDLLVAVLEDAGERRQAVFGDIAGDDLESTIREATERFFASLDSEGHLWRIQARERSSSEPRIRARVLEGRDRWHALVVGLFRPFSGDKKAVDLAADMTVIYFVGLIPTYLDLPPARRRRRRADLVESAGTFLTSGVTALLDARPRR